MSVFRQTAHGAGLALAAALAINACGNEEESGGTPGGGADAGGAAVCPEGQVCRAESARRELLIELTGAHAHVYNPIGLIFSVRDMADCTDHSDPKTCTPITGLQPTAFYRFKAGATERQALEAGVFEGADDGTYTWIRDFAELGPGVAGIEFELDGHHYVGAFTFESSKAGGERYFCDSDGDGTQDRSYQMRWHASIGRPRADGTEVAFTIELLRSFNTPINTETPWTNTFDHLRPDELAGDAPTVELMQGEGPASTSLGALVPTYAGKGLYTVKRAFAAGDLGGAASKAFWLQVAFTDDLGCAVNGGAGEDEREYRFLVAAP